MLKDSELQQGFSFHLQNHLQNSPVLSSLN
nr:MAG TPA: hypothetical protein [Caudoviricetes sp.]